MDATPLRALSPGGATDLPTNVTKPWAEVTEWKDLRAADERGLRLKSRKFEKNVNL